MALDVPAESLLAEIGEGWQTIAFPGLPVPYCFRGVHVQELIQAALRRGLAVTPIELFPQVAAPHVNPQTRTPYPDVTVFYGQSEDQNWSIFNDVVIKHRGVLTGTLAPLGFQRMQRGHAVAFEKGVICDPDGEAYLYTVQTCADHNFYPNCAYRIDPLESPYVQSIQPDLEVSNANIDN